MTVVLGRIGWQAPIMYSLFYNQPDAMSIDRFVSEYIKEGDRKAEKFEILSGSNTRGERSISALYDDNNLPQPPFLYIIFFMS